MYNIKRFSGLVGSLAFLLLAPEIKAASCPPQTQRALNSFTKNPKKPGEIYTSLHQNIVIEMYEPIKKNNTLLTEGLSFKELQNWDQSITCYVDFIYESIADDEDFVFGGTSREEAARKETLKNKRACVQSLTQINKNIITILTDAHKAYQKNSLDIKKLQSHLHDLKQENLELQKLANSYLRDSLFRNGSIQYKLAQEADKDWLIIYLISADFEDMLNSLEMQITVFKSNNEII